MRRIGALSRQQATGRRSRASTSDGSALQPRPRSHGDTDSRPGKRARNCMTNDKAGEAREGLLDSVAGKAKEVAGAVSGKDDLVEEGQLQQAEARKRRAAVADDAIADAKREEAAQEMRESSREAAEQKGAAGA